MGSQGNGEGGERAYVLDAGALIAFDRGDKHVVALLNRLEAFGLPVVVPATVLAQVWRGGSRSARLVQLLQISVVDSLDEERAREVGGRLGSRSRSDVADAHVVCCAISNEATIATSDGDDIRALIEPGERLSVAAT